MMNKIGNYIMHPSRLVMSLSARGLLPSLSDQKYIEMKFKSRMGYKLDLENPRTFNEKLQWLKLHDHRPEYTMMVDKYEAKEYVARVIGEEHIIPTLGVWDSFNEIDFNSLPNQFVLKCTHDSGGLVICKDKTSLNIDAAKRKIESSLKRNYYLVGREWPYKNVVPRIIAEKYMEDETSCELKDYKVFNFNGEPKFIRVCAQRFSVGKACESFYDVNWKRLDLKRPKNDTFEEDMACPAELEQMLRFSVQLSKDIPFLRTDFYCVGGQIYFGELTFFPANGMDGFEPGSWDEILGNWIELPLKK